ncbi:MULTISPECIES: hypothetical protein [Cellulomonas]|uniref:hypothetical protein n=1 Tax=Cellulomonas TaxID=1707 RepID=UPI0014562CAF|nr:MULTISPECIES: hypothetical protein [Cellulomonas]
MATTDGRAPDQARPENVDAARAVGMRAHLFRDLGACAAFLRAAVASGPDARDG